MPKTVEYIGTVQRWPELAITGKQSVWFRGQAEQRNDTEAAQLLATGLFTDIDATQLPEQKVVAISGVVSGAGIVNSRDTMQRVTSFTAGGVTYAVTYDNFGVATITGGGQVMTVNRDASGLVTSVTTV